MVCMDDVFEWFNVLDGPKRIDFVCGLLPMCHPLELRYFGSYLEDLAKKDFYALRDAEIKSNDLLEVSKLVNVSDKYTRSKIITALALLNSYNSECANQLFQILHANTQTLPILQALLATESSAVQTVLLLTMAVSHPAFSVNQRQILRDVLEAIQKILGSDEKDEQVKFLSIHTTVISVYCLMALSHFTG